MDLLEADLDVYEVVHVAVHVVVPEVAAVSLGVALLLYQTMKVFSSTLQCFVRDLHDPHDRGLHDLHDSHDHEEVNLKR